VYIFIPHMGQAGNERTYVRSFVRALDARAPSDDGNLHLEPSISTLALSGSLHLILGRYGSQLLSFSFSFLFLLKGYLIGR
jgi:hypothetical protein